MGFSSPHYSVKSTVFWGDITELFQNRKRLTKKEKKEKALWSSPSRLSDYDYLVVFAQGDESLGTALLLSDPHYGVLSNSIQAFCFAFITPPQHSYNTL